MGQFLFIQLNSPITDPAQPMIGLLTQGPNPTTHYIYVHVK